MKTEIIINAAREEVRVALIENRVVTEIYLDRKKERGIVGNVYKGKVVKVLPGMQAAFVDIGTEKAAFLYVADIMVKKESPPEQKKGKPAQAKTKTTKVISETLKTPENSEPAEDAKTPASLETSEKPEASKTSEASEPLEVSKPAETPESSENSENSEISKASSTPETPKLPETTDTSKPLAISEGATTTETLAVQDSEEETQPAHHEEEEEVIDLQEEGEGSEAPAAVVRRSKKRSNQAIEDLLKEGQEVVVQVTKDPIGTKGPRVTTYVSLPGRYLVYMPMVNHVGVSRRIGKEDERQRLKEMIRRLRKKGHGFIVRTVSDGTTEEEFKQDIDFLEGIWEAIIKNSEDRPAPTLVHNDLDLIFRTVRDLFTKDINHLTIDSKKEYERIKEFVGTYLPTFLPRLKLWTKDEPIFDAYGIEVEISKATNRRVWLKSGGYIVIDHAEALTVIDVNTGRFVGKRDLEETIFKTNLEAVKEIACQLRLRNIGGIIIIDLIDMDKERNQNKVMKALNEAVLNDKAKMQVLKISELGLVQISRERTREYLMKILSDPCPYCDGKGHTKSPVTMAHELFREIRQIASSPRDKKVIIGVHPSVASLLYDDLRQDVEALEKQYKKKIIIKADSNLHIEQFDIVTL